VALQLARARDPGIAANDDAPGGSLEQGHHRPQGAPPVDLGRDVDPVGDADIGGAGLDQLQRVGGRARLDDLELDALVLVVARRERAVDAGVDGVRDEIENQGRPFAPVSVTAAAAQGERDQRDRARGGPQACEVSRR
jgi:hypothetical protein